jgi:acyl-coenzyme A synthetase/AMP-(fatty) acid ligase
LLGKAWYATGPQYGSLCQRATVGFSALLEGPAGDFSVLWIDIDQPCTVGYTSGTAGHPKGAVLTHRSILMNTAMTATLHVRTAAVFTRIWQHRDEWRDRLRHDAGAAQGVRR